MPARSTRILRELKPEIIINNRIGKGRKGMEGLNKGDQEYSGDFGTPEQQIPATGIPGVDWESCMTMNDTWGFRSDDQNWKSAETLDSQHHRHRLQRRQLPAQCRPDRRRTDSRSHRSSDSQAIGEWMKRNGESIYATQASPFAATPWGRCTRKTLADGTTRLYLHVFDWPRDGKLTIPDVPGVPQRAVLLDGGQTLEVARQDNTVIISVPQSAPDAIATVVVLDTKRE